MATHNTFDFSQSIDAQLAARIASLHSKMICDMLRKYTGRSVSNISVTYDKPGKANGAIELINKCPQARQHSPAHNA